MTPRIDWQAEPQTTDHRRAQRRRRGPRARRSRRRAASRQLLFGFAEHMRDDDLPGQLHRTRGGAACNRPAGWSSTRRPRTGPRRPGSGAATRTSPTSTSTALYAEASTRLGWAEVRIELPPGAYETLLPPGPVADLMIYTYWTASARRRRGGPERLRRRRGPDPDRRAGSPSCR